METVFSYIITFSLCLPSFAFFGGILAFFSMVLAQFSEVLGLLAMTLLVHVTMMMNTKAVSDEEEEREEV